MVTDQAFFVGRGNPKSSHGLKSKDANLHRLICLKKMPSSEAMLARALQLNRFSEKLQTIAEALIDDGHAATPEGRVTINHIVETMSTLNRHAIHTFFAFEQQERIRNQTLENVESVEAQGE